MGKAIAGSGVSLEHGRVQHAAAVLAGTVGTVIEAAQGHTDVVEVSAQLLETQGSRGAHPRHVSCRDGWWAAGGSNPELDA